MDTKRKNRALFKLSSSIRYGIKDLRQLSDEQLKYITHPYKINSFLDACPGSGKTEVIGIKAAYDISKWKFKDSGISVVTFTNSAAKELNIRIKKFGNLSTELHPHFIGTFDSWIHNYLLHPFSHYATKYLGRNGDKSVRLIDIESNAPFLKSYSEMVTYNSKPQPLEVVDYFFDSTFTTISGEDNITSQILKTLGAGDIKKLVTKKKKFINDGFATYSDVETICIFLLDKYPYLQKKLAQRFPVMIIDECQDLSLNQIKILEYFRANGTSLHFVGDLNQSIYDFRKVDPADIQNYVSSQKFFIRRLTNNFRSCQAIVNVCSKIIGNPKVITGHYPQITNPCILFEYDAADFAELPERFLKLLQTNSINPTDAIIVARGKATLSPLRTKLDRYSLKKIELLAHALHNWHKPDRSVEELQSALYYMGKFLCLLGYNGQGDSRNQYCPELFSSVSWRLLLKNNLDAAKELYPFTETSGALSWSKWVVKVKVHLSTVWNSIDHVHAKYDDVKSKLSSPSGKKDELVESITNITTSKNIFRTTTIHSVKGETNLATMLISSKDKKSDGGHYTHWLREGSFDPEHIRFAYVACSRPRSLLVMAVPKLSLGDKTKLSALGFI